MTTALCGVLLVLGLGTTAPDAPAATAGGLSLQTAWEQVLHQNPDLAVRRQEERAAAARVGPAGAWDNPMLMLGVMNLPTNLRFDMDEMTMRSVGITQSVPLSGARGLDRRAARLLVDEQSAITAGVAAERLGSTLGAYADLLVARRIQAVVDGQARTLKRVVDVASAHLSSGAGTLEDALRARADLARLTEDREQIEREATAAAADLNTLRGLPPDAAIGPLDSLALPAPPADADAWSSALTDSVPTLRALVARRDAYALRGSARARRVLPDLAFSVTYGVRGRLMDGTELDNMWSAQVSAALPIFAGTKERREATELRAMSEGASLERAAAHLQAERDLSTLHAEALRAWRTADAYERDVLPLDDRALDAALAGYVSGTSGFLNTLNAALAYYRDTVAYWRARQAHAAALAQALRWTGDPTAVGFPALIGR